MRVFYLDSLRCFAAMAVILLHIVAPLLYKVGKIPTQDWMLANIIDSTVRWPVPIFMMITGALLLTDQRPFKAFYYIKRRFFKVGVPFLVWSLFFGLFKISGRFTSLPELRDIYAMVAGIPYKAVFFHLDFFYYFIPLYFVAPLLAKVLNGLDREKLLFIIYIWLILTLFALLRIKSLWLTNLPLYTGYMIAGFYIYKFGFFKNAKQAWVVLGACIAATVLGTWIFSYEKALFFGNCYAYKSLTVALSAMAVFYLTKLYLEKKKVKYTLFVAKYSLGIYVVHPFFLYYVQKYLAWPFLPLPCYFILAFGIVFSLSLGTAYLFSKVPLLKQTMP